ncbi:upstream activation factor subunit spp27 isoform X2 [Magnolia sinica]|uniref:upstream activation factor subunit spp27 isoform X2 n=1 Tax=Magnolia sinica TaxID=86752 RepID=UPI002657E239|nr:upstream activation factor subunit spp27 isoform X2 [Magnolia sinica]
MISDSELADRLREVLRNSDLNTTTTAIVRRRLEEHFGVDLSEKKAFIREQVDLFLQSQLENVKEEEQDNEEEEEEEEEEVDEEDGRKRVTNKHNKENKRRGGGFTKLCSLSPQLQEFVGVSELARTEVVKQLWAYIRENNLQDPSNKRNIICDETLRALFRVDSINMFQMNKVLSKHIWPLASEDGPVKTAAPKEKHRKQEREGPDESMPKGKRQKGGTSGFLAPIPLSAALVKFIGTGESALSRADVVKRMWEYIKQNNLQDPADKRIVKCDEKLKELFEVDSFNGFTVSKLLTAHFIKAEQLARVPLSDRFLRLSLLCWAMPGWGREPYCQALTISTRSLFGVWSTLIGA